MKEVGERHTERAGGRERTYTIFGVIVGHQYEGHGEECAIEYARRGAEHQHAPLGGPQTQYEHANAIVDHAANVNCLGAAAEEKKQQNNLYK